ncbi:RNA polymerase-associated protein LEO1-like [Folsomia candida]|nr:RNA polymerase-associated protein LEO1-like [Folsomia candida]
MTENDWDLTGTVSPLQLDHPPFLKPHSLQLTPKEFASLGLTSGSGVEETPIAHEPARTPPPAELQALRIPHRDSLEMPSDQIAKMGNRSEGEPETPRPPQISTNPLVQDPYVEDRGAFGEQHPVIGQLSITDEDDNKESMADNEEHDDRILANNNVEAEIGNVLPIASDQEDAEDTRMTVDNDERSNEGQEQGDLSIASDEAILEPQPETIIPPEEEPSSSSSSAESLQAEPEEEESPSQSQSETFHAEELEHEKKGFEHEEKEVGEDNDDAPEQNDDEMYTNLDMPIDDASASAPTHPDMSSKYEQFQTMFNQLKTFQENCYTSEEEVSSDACGWDAFTRLVDDLRDLLSARGVAVLPPP